MLSAFIRYVAHLINIAVFNSKQTDDLGGCKSITMALSKLIVMQCIRTILPAE